MGGGPDVTAACRPTRMKRRSPSKWEHRLSDKDSKTLGDYRWLCLVSTHSLPAMPNAGCTCDGISLPLTRIAGQPRDRLARHGLPVGVSLQSQ
jgi:hypothetical protein